MPLTSPAMAPRDPPSPPPRRSYSPQLIDYGPRNH